MGPGAARRRGPFGFGGWNRFRLGCTGRRHGRKEGCVTMGKESISASIALNEGTSIAKVVLMPGDPLRAKRIAEKYLENPVCFNNVRNMLGYTGTYNGREVSVMGHGMGIPSIGIYSTELYEQFDVDAIIRIGSTGSLQPDVKLGDVVVAMGSSSNSSYGDIYGLPGTFAPVASYELLKACMDAAEKLDVHPHVGQVYSSDQFYYPKANADLPQSLTDLGMLAVEMESAGLYWTAQGCHKKALAMFTVSDSLLTHEAMTAEERQNSFDTMMRLGLETAWTVAGE